MPELTWTAALAWFGVLTGAASVAGLIVAVVGGHVVKAIHAEAQGTLTMMDVTTKETLRALGEGQVTLAQILERMDQAAEQRAPDVKDRLNGPEG